MRRMALFGSATVLCAVLALPSACDDTRRDWDVCHSEPCKAGFVCNAEKRCVAIVAAPVDASSEGGRPDASGVADGGDAAVDGDASAETAADAGDESALDGADDALTADGSAD
jgi:hypothetical protein